MPSRGPKRDSIVIQPWEWKTSRTSVVHNEGIHGKGIALFPQIYYGESGFVTSGAGSRR